MMNPKSATFIASNESYLRQNGFAHMVDATPVQLQEGNSGASNVGECAAYWLTKIVGEVNGYSAGMSKKAAVLQVIAEFPEAKVTVKSISSYVSYIRNGTRGFDKFGDLPRTRMQASSEESSAYESHLARIGKSA